MNIEELSKSQLILLTILVNFVTSVATGILTVSLLDNAPPMVTQTVNRVVERTIETVAQAAPAAVIKPPAPAPSTEERVTGAFAASAERIVWLYAPKTGTSTEALAMGTFISDTRGVVSVSGANLPKDVLVEFQNGKTARAAFVRNEGGLYQYVFGAAEALPEASSPTFVSASDLRLGSTVLGIGTDGSAATGIISQVKEDSVHTTLPALGAGAAVVDLSGNIVGFSAFGAPGVLMRADTVAAFLQPPTLPQ